MIDLQITTRITVPISYYKKICQIAAIYDTLHSDDFILQKQHKMIAQRLFELAPINRLTYKRIPLPLLAVNVESNTSLLW